MSLLGTSWEQALRQRVLDPGGLTLTGIRPAAPRAIQLDQRGDPVQPWHMAAFAPAGGLWMSGADLATWLGLITEAARPPAGPTEGATDRDQVLQAVRTTLASQVKTRWSHIGLAWQLFERDRVAWHNGGVLGASSFLGLDLANARAIGVFAIGNPEPALFRAAMRALHP